MKSIMYSSSSSLYSVKPLSQADIGDWFKFGVDNAKNREIVLEEISNPLRWRRFLVYDRGQVLGRFSFEYLEHGLSLLVPKFEDSLEKEKVIKLFDTVGDYTSNLIKCNTFPFAECMIRDGFVYAEEWACSLGRYGFRIISRKYEWVFTKIDSLTSVNFTKDHGATTNITKELTPEIERAYIRTASDSLDQSLSIEMMHGPDIGDFDFLITQTNEKNEIIGLCICECDKTTGKDWIKYIGVNSDMRRQNYALEMICKAINNLKTLGSKKIYSLIDQQNVPSIMLHERLGFVRTGESFVTLYNDSHVKN